MKLRSEMKVVLDQCSSEMFGERSEITTRRSLFFHIVLVIVEKRHDRTKMRCNSQFFLTNSAFEDMMIFHTKSRAYHPGNEHRILN